MERRFGRRAKWAAMSLAACVAATLPLAGVAFATTDTWEGSPGNASGDWSVPTNWNMGVPVSGNTVSIVNTNTNIINYDVSGSGITLGPLTLAYTLGGGISEQLNLAANDLTATTENIGDDGGVGTFNQSGGTNAVTTGGLLLGVSSTDRGNYILSGNGALTVSGNETIASSGIGTLTQSSGGSNTVTGHFFYIAANSGSIGNYNLESGPFIANSENVGQGGTGTLTQTGGSNTVNTGYNLNLGDTPSSSGTYNLSAGTLTVKGGSAYIGGFDTEAGGTGILNVSSNGLMSVSTSMTLYNTTNSSVTAANEYIGGGTLLNAGAASIVIGPNASGTAGGMGTFTQEGGTNAASVENVGDSNVPGLSTGSIGTYVQSGGANKDGGNLYLGSYSGDTGNYTLSNSGTVSVGGAEVVGFSGAGVFTQSGTSSNTITGDLSLGNFGASSSGTYTLSGGTLVVNGNAYVGGSGNTGGADQSAGGTGNLTVNGTGQMTVNGNAGLTLYSGNVFAAYEFIGGGSASAGSIVVGPNSSGGVGTLTQTGGANSAAQENIGDSGGSGGNGTYNQTGGTNTISTGNLYLGSYQNDSGFYNLSNTGLLTVNSSEVIGFSGTAIFTQTGGTNAMTSTNSNLSLGILSTSTGVYDISGGAVTVGGNAYVGGSSNSGAGGVGVLIANPTASSTGQVTVNGSLTLFNGEVSATNEYIGGASAANAGAASIVVGPNASGTAGGMGTFTQSGGNNMASVENVGDSNVSGLSTGSTGNYIQSGGANKDSGNLYLGSYAGDTGNYALSNSGMVSAGGSEVVGFSGAGVFAQSGTSSNTMTGDLSLGISIGSSGAYTLSGGTLMVGGNAYVGGSGNTGGAGQSAGGTGNLMLSESGQMTVNNSMFIYGGTVSANTEMIGGGGSPSNDTILVGGSGAGGSGGVTQTGGTNSAQNESVISTYNLSGNGQNDVGIGNLVVDGTYNLSGNGSLSDGGDEYISGTLIQSSGSNSDGGGLYIADAQNSTGTYKLSGGALTVGLDVYVGGSNAGAGGTGTLMVSGTGQMTVNGIVGITLYNGTVSATNEYIGGGSASSAGAASIVVGPNASNTFGGTGYFTQYGGTNTAVTVNVGDFNAGGGSGSTGTYTQNDGINSVGSTGSGALFVGSYPTDKGFYYLDDTSLLETAVGVSEYIGNGGVGYFAQAQNSTNNVGFSGSLYLGYLNGSSGTYTLSDGGSLSVSGGTSGEYVGNGGTGIFLQNGVTSTNTLSLGAGLTVGGVGGATGRYTITAGTLSVSGAMTVYSGGLVQIVCPAEASVGSLSITGKGQVDVDNDDLLIAYGTGVVKQPSPEATIRAYLLSGYNGGKWNGPGIISSYAADPTTNGKYAVGYLDGGEYGTPKGELLIKTTLIGDANLDGTVNLTDLLDLLNSYGQTGKDWSEGDYNYDGTVNLTDLLALLNNYGSTSAIPVQAIPNPPASEASFEGSQVVPEPVAGGLLLMGCLLLGLRRSRHGAAHS